MNMMRHDIDVYTLISMRLIVYVSVAELSAVCGD